MCFISLLSKEKKKMWGVVECLNEENQGVLSFFFKLELQSVILKILAEKITIIRDRLKYNFKISKNCVL